MFSHLPLTTDELYLNTKFPTSAANSRALITGLKSRELKFDFEVEIVKDEGGSETLSKR